MTNPQRKQLVDEWHNGNENMAAYCRSKKLNYQIHIAIHRDAYVRDT